MLESNFKTFSKNSGVWKKKIEEISRVDQKFQKCIKRTFTRHIRSRTKLCETFYKPNKVPNTGYKLKSSISPVISQKKPEGLL